MQSAATEFNADFGFTYKKYCVHPRLKTSGVGLTFADLKWRAETKFGIK